jgi:hypothetical protein
MGRYHVAFQGATAGAVNSVVGYLMCISTSGFNLKRVDASLTTVGSASAPPDQQCQLGIALATGAPAGTYTAATGFGKLNQNYPAPVSLYTSGTVGWGTTQPTFSAAGSDPYTIACSSRGGGILNWEQPDEWQLLAGTANGIVFVNRQNALTTPLAWLVDVEWEE